MTWTEAEAALASGRVVVLPMGARLKEHGRHLPLNTDWLTAEWLCRRVVAAAAVLAAPTLAYGYYPAFVEYPGSVSVARETCEAQLLDIARSLARHGGRKLYVLNTGVSTLRVLAPAKAAAAREGIALAYLDLEAAGGAVRARLATQGAGTHADEMETSLMLHIAADVVRMDRAAPDLHPEKAPGPLTRDPHATTGTYSPTGAWGDPTRATAAKGRAYAEALVAHALAQIAELGATSAPQKLS
jgi:creatinine amidohydrolase